MIFVKYEFFAYKIHIFSSLLTPYFLNSFIDNFKALIIFLHTLIYNPVLVMKDYKNIILF